MAGANAKLSTPIDQSPSIGNIIGKRVRHRSAPRCNRDRREHVVRDFCGVSLILAALADRGHPVCTLFEVSCRTRSLHDATWALGPSFTSHVCHEGSGSIFRWKNFETYRKVVLDEIELDSSRILGISKRDLISR